jgi:hypothetical protein
LRVLSYVGLDTSKVKKQFAKVKDALERDDFRSADVKKLAQGSYYRAKLDDTNRLLLQFVQHADTVVCLALEVIHQHRYDKSRFLRGALVDESKILDADSETARKDAPGLRYVNPTGNHFHMLDKVISFDDVQDNIYRTRPPMIVVGSAGSGKTALTLEKLKQQAGNVLYVTHSAFLAQSARELYFSNGFENEEQEPLFLSYREFLETLEVPEGREVTFALFQQWFQGYQRQYRFADAHQFFEEFRGVISSRQGGALAQEEYLTLGVKQSIFPEKERPEVYALFQKYLSWLTSSKLFDINLISFEWQSKTEPTYDFVVVDEVQDFTSVQLALILRTLKKPGQFLLCGDSNQIVHPNFFSWAAVKSLFWQDSTLGEGQHFSVLKVNFRNAREVTRVANALLKIKHARFGSVDRESNFLVEPVADATGSVQCLPDKENIKRELNAQTKGSTQFAVLVLRDEDKAKAKAIFQTPLIFSVHEAKGLEYPNIILYNFISNHRQTFNEISEGVEAADLLVDNLEYRRVKDKTDKSLEIYKFYINALYVAVTRATEAVIMVEADQNHALLRLMEVQASQEAATMTSKASSREDWEREAAKLELQGKHEQAEAIRSSILKVKPVPWEVWTPENIAKLEAKTFDPKNTSNKAARVLMDYALWHGQDSLLARLGNEAKMYAAQAIFPQVLQENLEWPGYKIPKTNVESFKNARKPLLDRFLTPYQAKTFKSIMLDCDAYGVNFRTVTNQTPLMLAALAGNLELLDALLARGANINAVDHFGHTAFMHSLNRAFEDASYAKGAFGEVFNRIAPPFFDVQVDHKLIRLYPHMGEYFVFAAMLAGNKSLKSKISLQPEFFKRVKGFYVDHLQRNTLHFPEHIVREERKKRTYCSGVLSRAEVESAYRPARKLWVRAERGHYLLNPELQMRVRNLQGEEEWRNLERILQG